MTNRFDVFLSSNRGDLQQAGVLGDRLHANQLSVFRDEWDLHPRLPWHDNLAGVAKAYRVAVVCIGAAGLGDWPDPEMREVVDRAPITIIPVLLRGYPRSMQVSGFTKNLTPVDLQQGVSDKAMAPLIARIKATTRNNAATMATTRADPSTMRSLSARLRRAILGVPRWIGLHRPRRKRDWGIGLGGLLGLLATFATWRWPLSLQNPSWWLALLKVEARESISLVAHTTEPFGKPVAGIQFTDGRHVSPPTNRVGATSLDLPASFQAGRQINIDLVDSAKARREHWFLVNQRINVPSPGEVAALMLMSRHEIYEVGDEVRTDAARPGHQAGESAADEHARVIDEVAVRHGLTSEQLRQAVRSFGNTSDPEDQAIAAYLEGHYSAAEKLLQQVAANKAVGLVGVLRYQGAAQMGQGKFKEAAATYREALAIAGTDTDLLGSLGATLFALADWSGAESLFRQALALDEQRGSPHVSEDLNNLAQVLQETDHLAQAEPLMRRSLALDEKQFGPEHPNVATNLSNLAMLLYTMNRLPDAEPLMRRALAIDQKSYGPDHHEVATDLSNLAELLKATGRFAEAEPMLRRALAIEEKTLGAEHGDVSTDLNNLALLLAETNRLQEAETLLRRALAIDEKNLGPDHPNVANRLNNLGALLKELERFGEAEPLLRRALAIDVKNYGPGHPNTAWDLANLAGLLGKTHRVAEAIPLIHRAIATDRKSFGEDSTELASDREGLARLLQEEHRFADAERLFQQALAADSKSLGPTNPKVALDLNSLALLFEARNRPHEAEPLLRRSLGILFASARANGRENLKTAAIVKNYRSLLGQMGKSASETDATIEQLRHER
jgi:tetratricopeptide (TPR) repeat protein